MKIILILSVFFLLFSYIFANHIESNKNQNAPEMTLGCEIKCFAYFLCLDKHKNDGFRCDFPTGCGRCQDDDDYDDDYDDNDEYIKVAPPIY